MKKLKLNFASIQEVLSRDQLKQLVGGIGLTGSCPIQCESDVLGMYECCGTMSECLVGCDRFAYCAGCWQVM